MRLTVAPLGRATMKPEYKTPSVVDMANQVIEMDKTIRNLEDMVAHYKGMYEMLAKAQNENIKHNSKMIGNILVALLDKVAR